MVSRRAIRSRGRLCHQPCSFTPLDPLPLISTPFRHNKVLVKPPPMYVPRVSPRKEYSGKSTECFPAGCSRIDPVFEVSLTPNVSKDLTATKTGCRRRCLGRDEEVCESRWKRRWWVQEKMQSTTRHSVCVCRFWTTLLSRSKEEKKSLEPRMWCARCGCVLHEHVRLTANIII